MNKGKDNRRKIRFNHYFSFNLFSGTISETALAQVRWVLLCSLSHQLCVVIELCVCVFVWKSGGRVWTCQLKVTGSKILRLAGMNLLIATLGNFKASLMIDLYWTCQFLPILLKLSVSDTTQFISSLASNLQDIPVF